MAEEEKLKKETKSMLRAVLISAPRGVIARKLQAEYESITGKSIPYRKLGFCTLEDYLRSIPDVISASEGSTGELTFFGVADASTDHIAKVVSKQRKPKLSRAHVPPPRAFTPKQNKFFGHRSPMRPAGPSSARFNDRGPRRTPLMESTRMAPHSTESQDMLLSADGIGNCRDDLSKAHLVPIRSLSSQVTISKNRMVRITWTHMVLHVAMVTRGCHLYRPCATEMQCQCTCMLYSLTEPRFHLCSLTWLSQFDTSVPACFPVCMFATVSTADQNLHFALDHMKQILEQWIRNCFHRGLSALHTQRCGVSNSVFTRLNA